MATERRRPGKRDTPEGEPKPSKPSRLAGTLHSTASVELPAPAAPSTPMRKHAPRGYSASQLGGGGTDAAMGVGVWRMASRNANRPAAPEPDPDDGTRRPKSLTGPLDHPISAPPKRPTGDDQPPPPKREPGAPPPKRPTDEPPAQSTAPGEVPGAPEDEQ